MLYYFNSSLWCSKRIGCDISLYHPKSWMILSSVMGLRSFWSWMVCFTFEGFKGIRITSLISFREDLHFDRDGLLEGDSSWFARDDKLHLVSLPCHCHKVFIPCRHQGRTTWVEGRVPLNALMTLRIGHSIIMLHAIGMSTTRKFSSIGHELSLSPTRIGSLLGS